MTPRAISKSFTTIYSHTRLSVITKHALDKINAKLQDLPARGRYPEELIAPSFLEYREVFFKPYLMIYRVIRKDVYVYLIADGRRDM